jgi:hypothetical protein
VLAGHGIAVTVCPRIPLEDGIQVLRGLVPTCWFDREQCRASLEALCTYRRDYGLCAQELRARPLDDRTRHYAEPFRYFAVGYREVPAALRRPLPRRDNGWVVWPWRK